jgi:hypothetical protein
MLKSEALSGYPKVHNASREQVLTRLAISVWNVRLPTGHACNLHCLSPSRRCAQTKLVTITLLAAAKWHSQATKAQETENTLVTTASGCSC